MSGTVSIQAAKMKFIFSIISVLLYCSIIISPVTSDYFYDNDHNGIMSKVNLIAYTKYNSLHKKRFTANSNPRHRKVMKALPLSYDQVQIWNTRDHRVERITENYNVVQQRNKIIQEERKQIKNLQDNKARTIKMVRDEVTIPTENRFDPKHDTIPGDNKNNRNAEIKALTMNNGNDKGSMMLENYQREFNEKQLHVTQKSIKVNNARRTAVAQVPSHYRRASQQDSGKKVTHNNNDDEMHKVLEDISTKIKKKYEKKKQQKVKPGRIGGAVLQIETTDTPYAVFYRMSPIDVHEQDIFFEAMDDSYREKRLNSAEDVFITKQNNQDKQNAGNVILHKKVKNFSNFKSNKKL